MTTTSAIDRRRCSVVTVTFTLVLLATIAARLPAGARALAIRDTADDAARHRRDVSAAAVPVHTVPADLVPAAESSSSDGGPAVVREKRTLLKLKPLIVLPAKLALGAGAKLVAGAKLGVKAVEVGSKALGVGVVGLKAVKKVAKVTVKAATALGIKAVLLNFLFQKINQAIDFKTRLLGNLDQRNRQQNAQFLSPVPKSSSIGNKDETAFVPETPLQGFVGSADSPGFVTVAPPQSPLPPPQSPLSPQSFSPGSDLIASPPPPPPQDFDASRPQGFDTSQPQGFDASQPQPQPPPSQNLVATGNDEGSPLSDMSF